MSKRTDAISSVRGAAKAAGGSHLTIQARQTIVERVVEAAYARGQQVTGIAGLRERHVAQYVRERQAQGISARTIQTELAAIRTTLVAAGREQFARAPGLATRAFEGVADASREGTRAPATRDQVRAAVEAARTVDRGVAACVRLQAALGLRAMEAVRAGASLAHWERQLDAGQRVTVSDGTKGGRTRDVAPVDRAAALSAVREARAVADERGGRLLAGSLQQAETAYRHAWERDIGPAARDVDGNALTSHQLRAAWTAASVNRYEREGCDHRRALELTARDLGHGDGRGRWVERVYLARASGGRS